jgi:hypothetical protein
MRRKIETKSKFKLLNQQLTTGDTNNEKTPKQSKKS